MTNDAEIRIEAAYSPLSDEVRWQAVLARDGRFDGQFYYSVDSTGIYCQPSCPARRPRRDHVGFHRSPEDAEAAGFRPCKRCKPGQASSTADRIARACRMIETAEEPPSLGTLATAVGLSPHHFHRQFKATLGVTPKAYAMARRNGRIRQSLRESAKVTEAIYEAGFSSNGRHYTKATEALGMTPHQFRSGGADQTIKFAFAESSLGTVLVAASERGICAIFFGDTQDALRRDLEKQFPRAKIVLGDADFARLTSEVIGLIDDPNAAFDLPLDIRGTSFQHRVWEALRQIPVGSTASYAEIATAIGRPNAARAVARACASNRIAVVIPCHRVVRSDGSLSGYRGGVARKRAFLNKEKVR
jgi:AraC family transcriptional regulator, regulatory protein of adaptative response / methylated-DNA-[protein]-cysteine methyltransferase